MALTQRDEGHDDPGDIIKRSEGGEGVGRNEQTPGKSGDERPEEVVRKTGGGFEGVDDVKSANGATEKKGKGSDSLCKIPPTYQCRNRDTRGDILRSTTTAGARWNKNGSGGGGLH